MSIDHYDRRRVSAGEILFSAGDIGAAAYLVESGCLEIFLERNGDDLVLARRGVGEIVGEMAILDQRPRSASARAVSDTSLIVITEASIVRRVDQTDPILRMCLGTVLSRYRETVAMLDQSEEAAAPTSVIQSEKPSQFSGAFETLVLEREMEIALERSEFELHFQPVVNLKRRTLVGFESLMRWRHPQHGLIQPSQFIPVAEASGFISALTEWAFGEVGRSFPEMSRLALTRPGAVEGPLFMSVNVSGYDLSRMSFATGLSTTLARAGIAPSTMTLEVTESVLMKNPILSASILAACRRDGLKIAIDDFGTGYSSLSSLSTLPITTLKIDRGFVQAMLADPKSRKIVQTILRLADELAIPVVAEGIEHAAEALALEDMGCALGQGYLFGRPAPVLPTLDLIRQWRLPEPWAAVA